MKREVVIMEILEAFDLLGSYRAAANLIGCSPNTVRRYVLARESGFPEAIEATWPQACVQTCVLHLIRSSMRFVSYKDPKEFAKELKTIYTAANDEAAEMAF